MIWTKAYWKDAFERTIATAAAAVVGTGVVIEFWSVTFWQVVGTITGLTFVKVLAASQFGAEDASLLPAKPNHRRTTRDGGFISVEGAAYAALIVSIVAIVLVLFELRARP